MKIDNTTVAVVTGAASGIGRALAVRLAAEGAQLAICDVNETELKETARLATKPGVKISTHVVDVSDRGRMQGFVSEVIAEHGRAHLIINNAGVALGGTVEELAIEDFEWLLGINLWGVLYGTKMFLPILRQQAQGHIVNISSVLGLLGLPFRSGYAIAKHAINGFTRSLAVEVARAGITVNAVAPGYILTETLQARLDAGLLDYARYAERAPAGRWGLAEEVAHLIAFLALPASGTPCRVTG